MKTAPTLLINVKLTILQKKKKKKKLLENDKFNYLTI